MQFPGREKVYWLLLVVGLLIFVIWRMIRPMNIFVVSDEFARPMVMTRPSGLESLKAEECGECHAEIYKVGTASPVKHVLLLNLFTAISSLNLIIQGWIECNETQRILIVGSQMLGIALLHSASFFRRQARS